MGKPDPTPDPHPSPKSTGKRKSVKSGKRTSAGTVVSRLTPAQRAELIRSLTPEERLTETNYAGVASFLGISVRNVQHYMAQGCPGRPASSSKHDGIFYLPEIVQWCKANIWKPKKGQGAREIEYDEFGDPLVPIGDPNSSPALEEYRRWRAKLAKLDYEARKEKLIDVAQVHTALTGIAQSLRLAGEQMKREFGNGPVEIFNEALREMEEQIAEHFDRLEEEEADETEGEDDPTDLD